MKPISIERRLANSNLYAYLISAVAFIYYLLLLTDGKFLIFLPSERGMIFNNMLEHLLRGEFNVDPAVAAYESFVLNGKTYSYFGIAPVIFRLPLLATGTLAHVDITLLSCATAVAIGLLAKIKAVLFVSSRLPPSDLRALTRTLLIAGLVLGGAQVQFLRASIYQEALDWAGALAAMYVYCCLRGLLSQQRFSTGLVWGMATLAGLTLLTKVSTAVGLYVATGLLLVVLASAAPPVSRSQIASFARKLMGGRTLGALVILLAFAAACGIVNYERWGNPLVFADFHYYPFPHKQPVFDEYGEFNIRRLWYGLLYYFFPIWTIIRPDGQLLFSEFQSRVMFNYDVPMSTFLLSDPLLLVFSGIFILSLPQLHRAREIDLRAVAALVIGFAAPILLMLTAIGMTYRYRMEFHPLIEFLAYLGFYAMCMRATVGSPSPRGRSQWLLIICAGGGIAVSHALLLMYKLSWYLDETELLRDGWIQYYGHALKTKFPTLAAHLPF